MCYLDVKEVIVGEFDNSRSLGASSIYLPCTPEDSSSMFVSVGSNLLSSGPCTDYKFCELLSDIECDCEDGTHRQILSSKLDSNTGKSPKSSTTRKMKLYDSEEDLKYDILRELKWLQLYHQKLLLARELISGEEKLLSPEEHVTNEIAQLKAALEIIECAKDLGSDFNKSAELAYDSTSPF